MLLLELLLLADLYLSWRLGLACLESGHWHLLRLLLWDQLQLLGLRCLRDESRLWL